MKRSNLVAIFILVEGGGGGGTCALVAQGHHEVLIRLCLHQFVIVYIDETSVCS